MILQCYMELKIDILESPTLYNTWVLHVTVQCLILEREAAPQVEHRTLITPDLHLNVYLNDSNHTFQSQFPTVVLYPGIFSDKKLSMENK